jgi:hypothetical protein
VLAMVGKGGLTGGDDDGTRVPFLPAKVRKTAVTNSVKKIKRKLLKKSVIILNGRWEDAQKQIVRRQELERWHLKREEKQPCNDREG